jgi:adenylate kinase family enzyme|tara:strand:+ start:374 stop:751 length:378 start_codon:yes stop_codon:yes gene_type:complete
MNMALKLFKTLGTITIITPPSMVNPSAISFCLINLKEEQKNQFAVQLNKIFPDDNIIVYMNDTVSTEAKWYRQAILKARFVVVDKTNLPIFVQELLTDNKKIYEFNGEQSVESIFNKIKTTYFPE